jgi:hypothetical protein
MGHGGGTLLFGTCADSAVEDNRKRYDPPRALRPVSGLRGALWTSLKKWCPYRELHPAVLMMKPAEKRPHGDLTEPLDRPAGRRILAQRQMRSKRVVITRVARKDSA